MRLQQFVATLALAATATLLHAAEPLGLTNAFFAMDTAVVDAQHPTYDSRAQLLKELGYAGAGWRPGGAAEFHSALSTRSLQLFAIYTSGNVEPVGSQLDPQLTNAIAALKGTGAIIWLPLTSKAYKPSQPEGDEAAVKLVRGLADLAEPAGLKVALYPHTWFWMERVQDAVRVAQKVNRKNVGVTFNLCHCLKVGDEAKIPQLLQAARPHLFLVTINGADHEGNWDKLIQPLGRGTFDVHNFLKTLKDTGYTGPIGLQHYGLKGGIQENLKASIDAWKEISGQH
jgi:sugar phosphate isomerase/epimerase